MRDHSASAAPDQDHEFELVLGNKQLFSVLFVVFVLLGVFFAMGYLMGRTSAPIEASVKRPETADTTPVTTGRRSTIEGAVARSEPDDHEKVERSYAPAAAEGKAPETEPAAQAEGANLSVVDPKPGQIFLQVSAVAKPEAEVLVEVLTKKGFHAVIAPGPNEKLFRVLVGPARDDADLGKTRTDLEQAGFRPIPRRY